MTTSPESKVAAAMAKLTVIELPDDLRIPLHSLQADTRNLLGRVAADGSAAGIMADSILERLSQIETAALLLANRQNAAPDLYEALKAILSNHETVGAGASIFQCTTAEVTAARAALAKAEGR